MEFDGGLSRAEAERASVETIRRAWHTPAGRVV
jgi:hypothetical protein